jgi:hypothetical protein
VAEARAGVCPEGDVKLMAQRDVLEGKVTVGSAQGEESTKGDQEQPKHLAEYQRGTA